MGIVVFGAVFVDIKGYPIMPYIPGGRNVGSVIQVHGGVSRNIAEDLGNLQLKPVYISVVDNTGTSTDVLEHLKQRNVDVRYIPRTDTGLGTWLAVFNNKGDVVASISSRPDLSPISDILDHYGEDIFRNADSIIVEIDMEEAQLSRIFYLAEKYGKAVYAAVSNMSLALERRDLFRKTDCVICNRQEASLFFSEDFEQKTPRQIQELLPMKILQAGISRMIITLGDQGAVFAETNGQSGYCQAQNVQVIDTTGAGDAFLAGVAAGLTYQRDLAAACDIGTRLAASVIATRDSVCPVFRPEEFGLILPAD